MGIAGGAQWPPPAVAASSTGEEVATRSSPTPTSMHTHLCKKFLLSLACRCGDRGAAPAVELTLCPLVRASTRAFITSPSDFVQLMGTVSDCTSMRVHRVPT